MVSKKADQKVAKKVLDLVDSRVSMRVAWLDEMWVAKMVLSTAAM